MTTENKGYSLALKNCRSKEVQQKVYLKPMALYIPDNAVEAVTGLVRMLSGNQQNDNEFVLSVTNNNNGVSVDKDFDSIDALRDPLIVADAVKDLINIVRGYESDEETNVCGW